MASSFVGRIRELAVLRESVEQASAGRPRLVLIHGEGGSGKTSLLRAFRDDLSNIASVAAAGDAAEAALPYGVVDELARQLGPTIGWTRPAARDRDDAFAVGAAFLQMLGRGSQTGPLVVIIDDAHVIDEPSLAAMTFAARRLQADPVLLVLALREQGAERLPPGLVRLVSDRGSRLRLGGLSVDEVLQLSEAEGFGRLSRAAATRLREHTDGNPLHLRALLPELTLEQAESLDTPLPVPRSFGLLVLGALGDTSPDAQQLAAAGAVLGVRSNLNDAAAVAGLADGRAAADDLNRANMAKATAGPDGTPLLQFTHPLIHAAVYDDIGLVTRATLHTRAAHCRPGSESLRHRVAAAHGPDRTLVDDLLAQAVQDRAAGLMHTAATQMLTASRLCAEKSKRDRILLDAVDLLLTEGDIAGAVRQAPAVAAMPEDARRLLVQARTAWLNGRSDDAEAFGRAAWERAGELDPAERDGLTATLAHIAILRNEGAAASEWAGRALASGLLPAEAAGATLAIRALGLSVSGRTREGLSLLASALVGPAIGAFGRQQLLSMQGLVRMISDDLDGARRDLVTCLPSATRGMRPHQLTALGALAEVEYRVGDWDASASAAEQLVGLVDDTGQRWLSAYAHAQAMAVPAARGQWAVAQAHADAARQAVATVNNEASRVYADSGAVQLAHCRGDHAGVLAAGQALVAEVAGTSGEPGLLGWPAQYVTALVDLHRLDEAETVLHDMEVVARDRQHRSRQAALARVRGELEAAKRRTGEARAAFEEALRLSDPPGDALEAALAHAAYGRFLRRRGERRHAVQQLETALDRFTALGAVPFAARCEAELAATGTAARQPLGDPRFHQLTPQEMAVARLVAAGQRNQEIADQLVLSVKTVDYHLGHVYAKLGVRSRTELAAGWTDYGSPREP